MADGAGVGTGDGDAVGATVGRGAVVAGTGLVGVIRAVRTGGVADGGEEGTDRIGAVDRAGAGVSAAA